MPHESNNPYRGTEQHGVAFDAPAEYNMPDYDDDLPVKYLEDNSDIVPIPVRIVGDTTDEVEQWDGTTFTLNRVDAVLLASRVKNRTSLNITNEGPDPVFLHPSSNNNTNFAAVKLNSGSSFSLNNSSEVWGFVADGTTAIVRVVWEFTVGG